MAKKPLSRRITALVMWPIMMASFVAVWITSKLGKPRLALEIFGGPMNSAKLKAQTFKGYQPAPHDVFVCTYSKSGTNWAMQIAFQIAHRGQGEYNHIHDKVPWPDAPLPYIVSLDDESTYRGAPTGLRAIKTHLESQYVPYSPDAKYIVVVRDPKEVCVSSYFFSRSMLPGKTMVTPEEWKTWFLHGKFQYGSWIEHLISYWPWRNRDNVLYLNYSELQADLEGTVRRIADLMGVKLSEAELAQVVQKSTFAYMKPLDHKFAPVAPFPFNRWKQPVMIRKGAQRASSELLTEEQQTQIDDHMRAELRRRGCDFPYDEMFATAAAARSST
jgi:hypothetical protein